jgi:hypothetical protein
MPRAKDKTKIRSQGSQRVVALLGVLFAVVLVGLLILAWQLTRTDDFSWEQANTVEAKEAARKLKLLNDGVAAGKKGFVRLSQIEVNSYLMGLGSSSTNEGRVHLTDVKVELTKSNFTLVSFGNVKVLRWPVPIAMQREFRITQEGTNQWAFPLDEVRVGDVKIPRQLWPYLAQLARRLDEPLGERLMWATNLPSLRIARNESTRDPELRLYTYKPVLLD